MTWNPIARARRGAPGRSTIRHAAMEALESRTLMTAVAAVQVNGADLAAAGAQRAVVRAGSGRLDANVAASIGKDDLRLWNRTSRQFVDIGVAGFSYAFDTRTATWTFPASGVAALGNGDYRATLLPMGIYDAPAGNPLDGNGD